MGAANDFLDWVDGAEHVRNGGHRNELRPFAQQPIERVDVQPPVVGDRNVAHDRAERLAA